MEAQKESEMFSDETKRHRDNAILKKFWPFSSNKACVKFTFIKITFVNIIVEMLSIVRTEDDEKRRRYSRNKREWNVINYKSSWTMVKFNKWP